MQAALKVMPPINCHVNYNRYKEHNNTRTQEHKLSGAVDMEEGRDAIQRDLD